MNDTYENGIFGADSAESELNPLSGTMGYWAVYAGLPDSAEATWLLAVPDKETAVALVDALASLPAEYQERLRRLEGGVEPAGTMVRAKNFVLPFQQSLCTWELTWQFVIVGFGPEQALRAVAAVLPLFPEAERAALLTAYRA